LTRKGKDCCRHGRNHSASRLHGSAACSRPGRDSSYKLKGHRKKREEPCGKVLREHLANLLLTRRSCRWKAHSAAFLPVREAFVPLGCRTRSGIASNAGGIARWDILEFSRCESCLARLARRLPGLPVKRRIRRPGTKAQIIRARPRDDEKLVANPKTDLFGASWHGQTILREALLIM
jgi:hypothetical protein